MRNNAKNLKEERSYVQEDYPDDILKTKTKNDYEQGIAMIRNQVMRTVKEN